MMMKLPRIFRQPRMRGKIKHKGGKNEVKP